MRPAKTNGRSKTGKSSHAARKARTSSAGSKEQTTQQLEKRIPTLAKSATRQAFRQTLASGSKVIIASGGQLKEVSPDGKERVIKQIEPSVKMKKGQIIEIK